MGISIIENNIFNLDMLYMNINEGIVEKESKNINKISNYIQYKIRNISRDKSVECLEIVANDKLEVKVIFRGVKLENIYKIKRIKLKGLDENATYMNTETKEVFSGGALMNYGVNITTLCGDNYNKISLKMI